MWVEFVVGSLPCSERFSSGYSGFPLSGKKKNTIYNFLMLVLMIMITLIIIVMIMKVIMTMVITVNNNNNNNNNNSNWGTAHILRKVLLGKCTLYYEGLWFCSQCLRKMEDLR